MYDFKNKKLPYGENLIYLYCVSKYPTMLSEIEMPNFNDSLFLGFSDHTVGVSAAIYAISKGATYIEKHFSNNKSMGVETQMAHICSMNEFDLRMLREQADSLTLLRKK